jgi:phosphate transport system substrate-binding protein
MALVVATLAGCDGAPDSSDSAGLVRAILADLPVVDGSTSTSPMRALLLCGLLEIPCGWREDAFSPERWVAPVDPDSPEARLIEEHAVTSGTHGSYESLVAGNADVIIVARAPSDEESAAAAAAGVELDVRPVALDAFVFLVNGGNPVKGLTLEEIRGIYSGGITDWSEVGGPSLPIQPYQRDPTSGSQELMLRLVMGGLPMVEAPDWLMLYAMTGPFNALAWDVSGIGYSVYYYAEHMQPDSDVEMIAVDGARPTPETIARGVYPLVAEVYAVARAGETGSARAFFDWLITEEGQQAIADTGYLPPA